MDIVLDTGPLGLLSNPNKTPETVAATRWAVRHMAAGNRLIVPSVADFEVRRELLRAGKRRSVTRLDVFNAAQPDRYLPLSDAALRSAAALWATARQQGAPTADPKELDCDVLIAAQALEINSPDFIVATGNVGHLSLFVPADLWRNI